MGMKTRNLVGLSAHSAFHWWSAHCTTRMLLFSDELMSCCAAGTNECLDMRRHAFALDGRVSAEWSRCAGSVARRARNSVAPLRRNSAGWMPARMGRLSAGVGRRHPVTIRKASLMAGSMRRVWALRYGHSSPRQTGGLVQNTTLWRINAPSVCNVQARDGRVRSETWKWYVIPNAHVTRTTGWDSESKDRKLHTRIWSARVFDCKPSVSDWNLVQIAFAQN